MRRIVKWFDHHYKLVLVLMSCIIILFAVMTHMTIEERKASEKIHVKLNHDNETLKFLIREGSCQCERKNKR